MVEAASTRLAKNQYRWCLLQGNKVKCMGLHIIRDYTAGDPLLAGAGICHIVLEMDSCQLAEDEDARN